MPAALPVWRLRRAAVLRARAIRGDPAAFTALYERHHQALYRYCRSLLHDDEDARDALQSTMAKAFAALQHEERDFDLRPWLFRIAHNESISLLRRRRESLPLDLAREVGTDSLPETVEMRERLARLREDLADLPERQRSALVLRELSGLGHEEIATVLDSSPRATKQTIFEARTSLGEFEEGRAMQCAEIQRLLSDADGRVLRGRRVRAHLRSCAGCRRFKAALAQRPSDLALLAPPLPAAAGAALLTAVAGGGTATAGAGAAGTGAGGTALASKIVAAVTATAVAAGGTVAATDAVRDHRSSKETDRAPRQAASPVDRSSSPGRSGQGVPVQARRQPAGQGALDKPARRRHRPTAAETRPPGAASSPSHVPRPARARGGGRPDRPAPSAGPAPKPAKPVKPVKAKTPTRRQVGHTRPQPAQSQGQANGHEKAPNGPKPAKTPKPAPPQAGNGNGNGHK